MQAMLKTLQKQQDQISQFIKSTKTDLKNMHQLIEQKQQPVQVKGKASKVKEKIEESATDDDVIDYLMRALDDRRKEKDESQLTKSIADLDHILGLREKQRKQLITEGASLKKEDI